MAQHFLLSAAARTLSLKAIYRDGEEKAYTTFCVIRWTETNGEPVYRTRDAARADVFDYIERFYNTVRRHSTLGYISPVEYERQARLA